MFCTDLHNNVSRETLCKTNSWNGTKKYKNKFVYMDFYHYLCSNNIHIMEDIKQRLETFRKKIKNGGLTTQECHELESLSEHIEPTDKLLRQWGNVDDCLLTKNVNIDLDLDELLKLGKDTKVTKDYMEGLIIPYVILISDSPYFYKTEEDRDKEFKKLKTLLSNLTFID